MREKECNILAISGSLRRSSSNKALMKAAILLAPIHMNFTVYEELNSLPHFNPDLDVEEGPIAVQDFRGKLRAADGLLICTPEYGNGVPGVLKNALDWVVSSAELMNKPAAIITASPSPRGGDKAMESLLLTLNMIHAEVSEGATLMIPHIGLKLNAQGEITDEDTKQAVQALLRKLHTTCEEKQAL
ncbi:NADPH-dependent FMN reductase [Marinicrinis sediminis]|uniref:NADPH-dependent FMN reductase n=1 Tax=Marinicrinis sediminis TaxID=1652465 RepID=A0ABW5RG59_9BACL